MSDYPKHYYECKHTPSWIQKCGVRTQTSEKMKEHCDKQPDGHCDKLCYLEPKFENYSPTEEKLGSLPWPNKLGRGAGSASNASDVSTNSSVYFIF